MTPYYDKDGITIYCGDCRDVLPSLPDESVNCVVTSPPYWGLRDYGVDGQLGLEATPEQYAEKMVGIFREVRRVLRDDGTLWLNLGDSYAGSGPSGASYRSTTTIKREQQSNDGGFRISKKLAERGLTYADKKPIPPPGLKPKDLCGIPWRVAFALQADGWYLRQDIIWNKPNPMPESVRDRCTKAHEYIFLLSKSARYYYDADAIAEPCEESNAERPRMGQGPNTQYSQKRERMPEIGNRPTKGVTNGATRTNGKHSRTGKQDAGRRIVENVAKARAEGNPHDNPFGDMRNKRSVWTVTTKPYPQAHFATFPPDLIKPCILAGCPEGGIVLDPFLGSGTTAEVARKLGCRCVGIELSEDYCELARERLRQGVLEFTE